MGQTFLWRKGAGRPAGNTGEATRQRIIQTAASMFSLQGWHKASLTEIAGACGMTTPAIYFYFKSKDVLFIEIICTMYEEVAAAFEKALEPDLGLYDTIDRALECCLDIYREDEVMARLGYEATLALARSPEHYAEFGVIRAKVQKLFVAAVARGVARGEMPPDTDVEETGAVLFSLIMGGISLRTLDAPSDEQFGRTIRAFRSLMFNGRA